ncbi:hypothetical protein SE15_02975 [Thermanaerothrix daxensis]|uniref:Chemotaxis protein CheA n=1 Tax=Thermanaerothrix daxensis TaxID=869279 RepID=A0A0P6Y571_9CHLR|nr:chemotaxis protein CheA [Thermanaerothrix daxensis]KPL84148.1 hypothetical protein SE15_02975 [Thermanaerothrix daxensis]
MSLQFDLSPDELPIFLAETDEHLQVLDEGLVRLERNDYDEGLIQALFRAAHTLKGSAGLIGHRRLVDLTHALETVFDALRKHTLQVTPGLIDLCLQGVDALRWLRDEVVSLQPSPVDVVPLVQQFLAQISSSPGGVVSPVVSSQVEPAPVRPEEPVSGQGELQVWVQISSESVASAARALQVLLVLQELGELLESRPTQAEIETAAPVHQLTVRVRTTQPVSEVRRRLEQISELERVEVQAPSAEISPSTSAFSQAETPETEGEEPERLGDYLIRKGWITATQLKLALEEQKRRPRGTLLGSVLVQMGFISQATLDRALADLLQEHRRALAAMQATMAEQRARETGVDKTVRTSVERLDALMNLIGELITDRNRLYQIRNQFQSTFQGHEHVMALADTIMHLSRITDQLQEEVMRIRMVPISSVFSKFPRMMRDLARKANKEVDLIIHGEDTELDRSVIDEIHDPLIHLVRNAIDHGIEPPAERMRVGKPSRGQVVLTARHEQGRIVLTVEDDGRGIDVERLKAAAVQKGLLRESEAATLPREKAIELIFASGLSTAKQVTEISGRGVGMDIVRNNIERINGSILVETTPGQGTRFQIILPLTLAIVPTLLVRVEDTVFALPLTAVTEVLRITPQEIRSVGQRPVFVLRDQVLPLLRLRHVFDFAPAPATNGYEHVVVVRANQRSAGLIIDELIGEEEVVVKSLGGLIGEVPGIASAAILGDGRVSLIVDVAGLLGLVEAEMAISG